MAKRLMALSAIGNIAGIVAIACGAAAAPTATPTKAPAATSSVAVAQPIATATAAQPTPTRPAAGVNTPSPTRATSTPAPLAKAGPAGKVTGALTLGTMRTDPTSHESVAGMPYEGSVADFLAYTSFEGKFVPGLAKSWEISADKSVWTFILNESRFQDGTPVTAEDVAFSVERARDLKIGHVWAPEYARKIKRAQAAAPNRVEVHTNGVYPNFIERLPNSGAGIAIVPKKVVQSLGDEEYAKRPVASGPFKLVRFAKGEFFQFTAFEDFWRGAPSVKDVALRDVQEETTRLAMLRSGEVDFIVNPSLQSVPAIKATPGLRILVDPFSTGNVAIWLFDQLYPEPSPVKDVRVRQALSYAIDRAGIIEKLYAGLATPGITPFTLLKTYPPHALDVDKTKRLMREAGYPDGFTIDVAFSDPATPGIPSVAAAVQGMWQKIGVNAVLTRYEHASYLAKVRAKQMRGLGYVGTGGQTTNALNVDYLFRTGGIYSYYSNPEIDRLYGVLDSAVDQKEIDELSAAINKIVYDEVPLITVVTPSGLHAVGPRIQEGWRPKGNHLRLEDLKLKP